MNSEAGLADGRFRVAAHGELAPGDRRIVNAGGISIGVFMVNGVYYAYRNVCPHAGRRLDWAPGRFLRDKQGHLVCAVHGATFELQGGECIAGPCRGAALRRIPVVVEDGLVRVVRT